MNWQKAWESLPTIIISASVIAAALAAIVNIVIALMNNRRLKSIEKDKRMTDIQKYRYTNLYELIKNWHSYSTKVNGDSMYELAANRLLNSAFDNIGRYTIARPLLHLKYISELDQMEAEVNNLFTHLLELETEDGEHLEGFGDIRSRFTEHSIMFEKKLKNAINGQLTELLLQDDNIQIN